MKNNKSKLALIAAIISFGFVRPTYAVNEAWLKAKAEDNEQMMSYAEKKHQELSKRAISWEIDPDDPSGMARYSYHMPDGEIVNCFRGVTGNTVDFFCR